MYPTKFAKTAAGRVLDAVADLPDIRDVMYEPTLETLAYPKLPPPTGPTILDQGTEGACTGFALAAVINQLMRKAGRRSGRARVEVSPRMLYKMAQLHDEWPGEDYSGSSLRGAIRGWNNMGVCEESQWPTTTPPDDDDLNIDRAISARSQTLGAYYRLKPRLSDFHAALNETGVIYISAQVHAGWNAPVKGVIVQSGAPIGGHAFAAVGYNEEGFWVQNSWGDSWGDHGLAIWKYEDWIETLVDAWVVQLAYPVPEVFGRSAQSALQSNLEVESRKSPPPRRSDIAGHFVHIDDGGFKKSGRYWSRAGDIRLTAERFAGSDNYDHLLFYAHGGLNSPKKSAARIAAVKAGFKRNRVYSFHIMYDTGLAEELQDLIVAKFGFLRRRTEGFFDDLKRFKDRVSDHVQERSDKILEGLTRTPGTALWREMKRGAQMMFDDDNAGRETLQIFLDALAAQGGDALPRKKIHMAGHSTGAVLLASLLEMTHRTGPEFTVDSLSLFAPACTVDLFKRGFVPGLREEGGASIKSLTVFNLTDALERDDNVAKIYRKSLLYMVSRSFEDKHEERIAGMAKYARFMPRHPRLEIVLANPDRKQSRSTSSSHGGFDNDAATMNSLLKNILGKQPTAPFTEEELAY